MSSRACFNPVLANSCKRAPDRSIPARRSYHARERRRNFTNLATLLESIHQAGEGVDVEEMFPEQPQKNHQGNGRAGQQIGQ